MTDSSESRLPANAVELAWKAGNAEAVRRFLEVIRQVELLCGHYTRSDIIISTGLQLRRDGFPLASQRQPDDPGVQAAFLQSQITP